MLSYTGRRNLYGKLTDDTSTANLSYGDTLMNEYEKRILNKYNLSFLEDTYTGATVASQQFYNLPHNIKKLIASPTITVGTTKYSCAEAPNKRFWDALNDVVQTSDVPQYFFIYEGKVGFYPTPSTSSNVITISYLKTQKDLSVADYVTGSIVSITNAATTVTGTGTTWTGAMAGRYIKITADNSTTTGDGDWYKIASVTSNTVLELVNSYTGTTIAAATQAYTIGQMSAMPDGYDNLPIYHAAFIYWLENGDLNKSDRFKNQRDEMDIQLISDQGNKTTDPTISDDSIGLKNPNLYIRQ